IPCGDGLMDLLMLADRCGPKLVVPDVRPAVRDPELEDLSHHELRFRGLIDAVMPVEVGLGQRPIVTRRGSFDHDALEAVELMKITVGDFRDCELGSEALEASAQECQLSRLLISQVGDPDAFVRLVRNEAVSLEGSNCLTDRCDAHAEDSAELGERKTSPRPHTPLHDGLADG